MNDLEYGFVKQKVLDLTAIDLDSYKEKQMRRRLSSYLERTKAPSIAAYFQSLEQDSRMLQELKDFLTINVSEFFRDDHQFEKLGQSIFPALLKDRVRLKVWSAGCSNGSEPYTLAIMLDELTPGKLHTIKATDVDETILTRARAGGPYAAQDVRNVRPDRLAKHFRKEGDKYWINDRIRERVEFTRHNLLSDPYEHDCDLILCRNVVIYFTDAAKREINRGFHAALREGGVLFIGGSEIIFDCAQTGFEIASPSFYRKLPVSHKPGYST
ncbi:MAG: protein-glutamate O-methyltransferase CheR, partial [Chloroflexi bacterium]|nr:protein-glutamate O-methyltransferase CheR [Chloroflexota bacterium]